MQPIIERIVASFVPDQQFHFRLLTADEFMSSLERADAERLRRRGYAIDPFTITGRFGRRVVYRIVADPIPEPDEVSLAAALSPEDDPFVGDLVTRPSVEGTIDWSPVDRALAEKFARASRLRALPPGDLRSPFTVVPS